MICMFLSYQSCFWSRPVGRLCLLLVNTIEFECYYALRYGCVASSMFVRPSIFLDVKAWFSIKKTYILCCTFSSLFVKLVPFFLIQVAVVHRSLHILHMFLKRLLWLERKSERRYTGFYFATDVYFNSLKVCYLRVEIFSCQISQGYSKLIAN